jgi:hypothetical protein
MHYATYDRYGSETSGGFDNTKVVLAFATAALRCAMLTSRSTATTTWGSHESAGRAPSRSTNTPT